MSDGESENIEITDEVGATASIQLDQEWIAWLRSEAIPASVEGVDESIDDIGADTAIA